MRYQIHIIEYTVHNTKRIKHIYLLFWRWVRAQLWKDWYHLVLYTESITSAEKQINSRLNLPATWNQTRDNL